MATVNSPEVGDNAPNFTLATDAGRVVSLADFKNKMLVLYFYPRDDTPGCTREAIEFTADLEAFQKAGAEIVGVSRDTVAKHAKFREKHDLGVTLGSDADCTVCEAYGVWVEKNMYGRKSMGIERATFLIGGDGRILRVWRKVKVAGHVTEVLEAVRSA